MKEKRDERREKRKAVRDRLRKEREEQREKDLFEAEQDWKELRLEEKNRKRKGRSLFEEL